MKRYVWAAMLLLLCPVVKAQSDSAAVATDTTDVYKNVGLGELTVKAQRQMVKTHYCPRKSVNICLNTL